VARNGPPDDFHDQATQHAGYGIPEQPTSGQPLPNPPEGSEQAEPVDSLETEPTPWYRRPPLLIAWLVFVAILLALIVYGITQLLQGGQGSSPTPSTSATSTTTTTSTATTTTTATTPTTSSAVEAPGQQPTQQPSQQPSQQEPTHRHHLPSVPPVITIPGVPTVITVPPGLR
jgi:cytoskeletal protein RodZ